MAVVPVALQRLGSARIRESRRLAEQLLATALREALAPPAGAPAPAATELELAEEAVEPTAPRRGHPSKKRLSLDNRTAAGFSADLFPNN